MEQQIPNRSLYSVTTRGTIILIQLCAVVAVTVVANISTMAKHTWIVEAFQAPVYIKNPKLAHNKRSIKNVRYDPNRILPPIFPNHHRPTGIVIMAAGSRSLNKQAALRQKLEQAKLQNFEQQQQQQNTTTSTSSSVYPLSEKEIRERNDRLRFEELLQKKGGAFIDSENDKEYKSRQQEDDEIDAVRTYMSLSYEYLVPKWLSSSLIHT
jgi:hypothetical protein